jgi:hypothetical protein
MEPPSRGRAIVIFDDLAFNEDVERASRSGRAIAIATRDAYERDDCSVEDLLACEAEGRDSTRLPWCVKVYLPAPAGKFGMVLSIERQANVLVLAFVAFGVRHQPHHANAPTVYQLAHRRLEAQEQR